MFPAVLIVSLSVAIYAQNVCPVGYFLSEISKKCEDCAQLCSQKISGNYTKECRTLCPDFQDRLNTELNEVCSENRILLIVVIVLVGFCACFLIKMLVYHLRRYCYETRRLTGSKGGLIDKGEEV